MNEAGETEFQREVLLKKKTDSERADSVSFRSEDEYELLFRWFVFFFSVWAFV